MSTNQEKKSFSKEVRYLLYRPDGYDSDRKKR
jgi:predicted peptidase